MQLHPWRKIIVNPFDNYEGMVQFAAEQVNNFDFFAVGLHYHTRSEWPDWFIPAVRATGADLLFIAMASCRNRQKYEEMGFTMAYADYNCDLDFAPAFGYSKSYFEKIEFFEKMHFHKAVLFTGWLLGAAFSMSLNRFYSTNELI